MVTPGTQVAVDDQLARDPLADRAPLLGPAPQRLLRHAGLARDLDAAGDRLLRRLVVGVQVPERRVHPDLRAGALADRRRLPAVVDVRVRADDEPHVLEPQPGLVERALEVRHRAGLVHAGVHEHDPVAGGERPGVAVRDARPRQREPQPPDAGSTRSPRPTSRLRVGLRIRRDANVPPHGQALPAPRRGDPQGPESEYRSPDGDVLVLRGALTPAARQEYAAAMAGSPLSREDAWQRGVELLFELLAVRWEIAGAEPIVKQKELLGRYRFATQDERRWIRDALREHLAAHFPDVEAP